MCGRSQIPAAAPAVSLTMFAPRLPNSHSFAADAWATYVCVKNVSSAPSVHEYVFKCTLCIFHCEVVRQLVQIPPPRAHTLSTHSAYDCRCTGHLRRRHTRTSSAICCTRPFHVTGCGPSIIMQKFEHLPPSSSHLPLCALHQTRATNAVCGLGGKKVGATVSSACTAVVIFLANRTGKLHARQATKPRLK